MVKTSKHVYVKSFGCSANRADGEVIAGCLSEAGFKLVSDPKDAKYVVYNTCAVKSPTENRIIDVLRKIPKEKYLIVAGCLPVINFVRLKNEVEFNGVIGPAPGSKIVNILERVTAGEKVVSLDNALSSHLDLPRVPVNPVVSVIPINYGCLGECSYCCVRFARGKLRSDPVGEIVKRVQRDLVSGVKELWLTSQDTACYGKDIDASLSDLLNSVCGVDGHFFIRLGMMNPNHALDMLDELVEAYECKKVFKFLHLPVQSGDDTVLELMNRRYTVNEFRHVVNAFRKIFPQLTLSTDIICGFPGESRGAFENTKKLIAEVKPDIVNISKFFSRPNTSAEKLSPIFPKELNRRSRVLTKLCKLISLEKNKSWLGWQGMVLFDEKGKGESWVGRNFAYKPIVVKTNKFMFGKFAEVKVVRIFPTYLRAKIIEC